MNRQDFLKLVRKEIHFIFDRKSIERELNEHLEDSIADLVEEGLSQEDAENQAVAQMGEPEEVGKLLNKEHHPGLGYLWMLTKVLLVAAVIFTVIVGFDGLQSALDLLYPSQDIGWKIEESYPVRVDMETKTHHITIDRICLTEYGDYYITYRARKKFNYIRSDANNMVLAMGYSLAGEPSEYATALSNGCFGEKGYLMFHWPGDDVVYLHGGYGTVVMEIDLKEYWK